MHRNYLAGAAGERKLADLMEPLVEQDYHVLSDRAWPGSSTANVDFIVVGPSGVFLLDAKAWGQVSIQNGRVFQDQDDVTDKFENFGSLREITEATLAEVGIAPGEIRVAAIFMGTASMSTAGFGTTALRSAASGVDLVSEDRAIRYLLERGMRLRPVEIHAARAALEVLFPPIVTGHRPVELTLVEPVIATTWDDALITLEEIEDALLSSIMVKPIEEWMAFLHPDQAKLARRSFNGPSRIRGAAGTGKTVVGLHRAAYIARTRPGTVLVTTFVRTLPAVLSSLMQRMAPEVADRIEFSGIHAFALKLLRDRGVGTHLDPAKASLAFDHAWRSTGLTTELARIDNNKDYWRDEVLSVIKGRGLTKFEQYAALSRIGRKRGLNGTQRYAVWQLHGAYHYALREAHVHDFADIILLAEQSLKKTPLEGYSAVVVDEAQDLSCAMIRMLHSIVGDHPDGLNLIGDGQQTIYPGGYTLSEANISIAGRGVIMTKNYRNTIEIADFALSLVAGDEFVDIEGAPSKADVTAEVVRHGAKPKVTRFTSHAGHDRSLIEHVHSLLRAGVHLGDIGILTHTNSAAGDVSTALAAAGLRSIELLAYDGTPVDAIKVGTIKRAKGLEFKQVLVVRTPPRLFEPAPVADESSASPDASASVSADAERRELDRRELYVAMTRARDGLWVGVA
ncbi:MAG: UvrD-helicase domain-containing protein [Actinomycetota bacterium]